MGDFNIGKFLIIIGVGLVVLGGIVLLVGKFINIGHLPGDIFIKGEHGSFYFPVVSCILVSIILSFIMNLFK